MFRAYRQMTNALLAMITAARQPDRVEATRRSAWLSPAQQAALVRAAQRGAERGLAPIAGAELSRRLRQDYLVISKREVLFSAIGPGDWIVVRPGQSEAEGAARHLAWHRQVYAETAAEAVLLAQPPYATLVAGSGLQVDRRWLQEVAAPLPIASGPLTPGALHGPRGARLIPGAGLLTWGETPEAVVEQAAQVEMLCLLSVVGANA